MDQQELILPHSVEAEQAVLGAVLLEGDLPPGVEELVSPEDFYIPAHRYVYEAMLSLKSKGLPVDLTTLTEELKTRSTLEKVGGKEYVVRLTGNVPTTANVEHYARIVRSRARVRRVIRSAQHIASEGYTKTGDEPEDFFNWAEQSMLAATRDTLGASYVPIDRSLVEFLEHVSKVIQNDPLPGEGVPTGYRKLDELLAGGFHAGDLVILAARPGMGKTSFALNMAEYVAMEQNIPVLIFSLEMGVDQLTQRLLASVARVNNLKLRHLSKLRYDPDAQQIVTSLFNAYEHLAKAPVYMDDTPGLTIQALRSRVRQWLIDRSVFPSGDDPHRMGLIIVDYLQLMRSPSGAKGSREQEVSEISRALKALAREVGMPVLALSQLNRRVEQREDQRPMLSDLRESGAIEQDADIIIFIHRPEVYQRKKGEEDPSLEGKAEILVAKHRHGPTGDIELHFAKEFTRFENPIDPLDAAELQHHTSSGSQPGTYAGGYAGDDTYGQDSPESWEGSEGYGSEADSYAPPPDEFADEEDSPFM